MHTCFRAAEQEQLRDMDGVTAVIKTVDGAASLHFLTKVLNIENEAIVYFLYDLVRAVVQLQQPQRHLVLPVNLAEPSDEPSDA